MKKAKKYEDYAALIILVISDMFNKKADGDLKIDQKELMEGENLTAFFHALSTVAPTYLYRQMTSDEVDILAYNHITNRMIHQFSKEEK